MGLYYCPEKKPAAELRAAPEQHPRRARDAVHSEAAAIMQPPAKCVQDPDSRGIKAPAGNLPQSFFLTPSGSDGYRYGSPVRHVMRGVRIGVLTSCED